MTDTIDKNRCYSNCDEKLIPTKVTLVFQCSNYPPVKSIRFMLFAAGVSRLMQVVEVHADLAESFSVRLDPHDADLFVGFSTSQGQMSPIISTEGTVFFKVLSQCLLENYKHETLDQIYTKVTNIVLDTEQEYKHVPQKVSTLRMPLYFVNNPDIRVRGRP